ncbi:High mobility group B protein 13 [Gracilariopsis chorda]|uniref:High mobility group B protein 13 n=1 Tax=Gracilariopsis chorda TaxID=448386 RepID=A0A2V3J1B1_9FLOR|nr:High mobility group B protein 13 [Gracilariopsis chorda]|eukprot:PXF48154.1 High mobility group B protein 13 [Gracilariopsis chorda]
MAPSTRTRAARARKPLAQLNHNEPIHTTPPLTAKPQEETVVETPPKPDIDQITEHLQQTTIANDHLETQPAPSAQLPNANPFGGAILSSASAAAPLALPKRPLTAYQQFCKQNRDAICQQIPKASFSQVNSKLGQQWRALSSEEQQQYQQQVMEDRQRYDREMHHINEQRTQAEKERLAIDFYHHQLKVEKALEMYEKHLEQHSPSSDNTAPAAPKQPRSAYNFFMAARFKEIDGNIGFGATAQIAEEWKQLQSSRKKKDKTLLANFNKMVADDEQRYRVEMEQYQTVLDQHTAKKAKESEQFKQRALEAYEASLRDKEDAQAFRKMQTQLKAVERELRKKAREDKKAAKEAKAAEPKRPKNAYAIFFSKLAPEVSEYIRQHDVEHSMAKEIAARWKALSDREKKPYVLEAEKDRERYQKEMNAFSSAQN